MPLVLFNEVLDHVLRIDRIFRQNQGHVLLIGISGAGKTTLSRFVAWMNGMSVFRVKGPQAVHDGGLQGGSADGAAPDRAQGREDGIHPGRG